MRWSVTKVPGKRSYLSLSHGSFGAKVYSSVKTKDSKCYEQHSLVYHESGKRIVRAFASLDVAKRKAELAVTRIGNGVVQGGDFKVVDFETYRLAQAELAHLGGVNLLDAVREYRAAVSSLNGLGTLVEAAREYVKARTIPQRSVPTVVAEMLAAKKADRLSKLHLRDLKIRLTTFAKAFPGNIHEIRTPEIEAYLRGLGLAARSRNNHAGGITTLFRYARRQGYLPTCRGN